MQSNSFVVVNEANKGSWAKTVWGDIDNGSNVFLQSDTLKYKWLKKLKKIHFSNKTNRKVWLPLKCLWDKAYSIKPAMLDPTKRNYIIFQTGIKFSPRYIQMLKRRYNACIVLYMPDTLRAIGLAVDAVSFKRFCKHYHVDQVYSFDHNDCEEFGLTFFDIYSSKANDEQSSTNKGCLYVGNCRSRGRLDTLHSLYKKLSEKLTCTFYINKVAEGDKLYPLGIVYNTPLSYDDVVGLVRQSDIVVEIMNEGQQGNTLRFKEAVCYNKRLLTNNPYVLKSKYYNPDFIQYFSSVEDIDTDWLTKTVDVDYHYNGEYSPALLAKMIAVKAEADGIAQCNNH